MFVPFVVDLKSHCNHSLQIIVFYFSGNISGTFFLNY